MTKSTDWTFERAWEAFLAVPEIRFASERLESWVSDTLADNIRTARLQAMKHCIFSDRDVSIANLDARYFIVNGRQGKCICEYISRLVVVILCRIRPQFISWLDSVTTYSTNPAMREFLFEYAVRHTIPTSVKR